MGTLCCKRSTADEVVECIHQIQEVEKTLERLINKYETQIRNEMRLARSKMHRKADCMRHMRSIHIIRHHKQNMEKRLTSCLDKRYQLESLNVTKMHMNAVRTTTKTYRQFLDEHDIEKIERLQDTLASMIDDACEIKETLTNTPSAFEIDEDEVTREYETICAEIQLPTEIQLPIPPSEYPSHTSEPEEYSALELIPLNA